MAIGLSHGGTNVYSSPQYSRQLWVGTQDGLVRFERANNGAWREGQRALRGQHISSIIFEPITNTMFAGVFFGSVHASSDAGKSWERRDNGIPVHDVYSLACHVVDGNVRVYAGTQPAHLLRRQNLFPQISRSKYHRLTPRLLMRHLLAVVVDLNLLQILLQQG